MDRKELTIVEHLVEFRKRLLAVVICFFLVFCVSLLFADQIYQYVTQSFQQKLIVLGPNDILWIYIRLASLMAFTITLPYTVYHIWSFIKPGLKKEEARAVFAYIPASFLGFLVGLAFGFYFVTPALLQVLLGLGEGLFETQLTAQNYLSFVFQTTLPLALIFELPVISAFLNSDSILPIDSPSSGNRFGPKIKRAPKTMIINPGAPISRKIPISRSFLLSFRNVFADSNT